MGRIKLRKTVIDDNGRVRQVRADIRDAAKELGFAVVPLDVAKYYANRLNYESGDVPGHIYALEDAGGMMRGAMPAAAQETDR